jgi:hypothetical protein
VFLIVLTTLKPNPNIVESLPAFPRIYGNIEVTEGLYGVGFE